MKLCRSLIGAVAVAALLGFASPASAHWHGRPGWGWRGHPGWWGGPRVRVAVGVPWGYGYPVYGYYAYPAPYYVPAPPPIYNGRVVPRESRDSKDVQSDK